MRLLRNLVFLALILGLIFIALGIITPIVSWAFKLVINLFLLGLIGVAIIYLYRKLRA